MKGRKPKSKHIRLVEGNREKKPINMNEPEFDTAITCPAALDAKGRAEWRRLAVDLANQGLLTKADRAMFAGWCFSWSVLERAMEAYKANPQVKIETERGGAKTNPAVVAANAALVNLKSISSVFGFSPGDRQRIKVEEKEQSLEELLADNGKS